MKKRKNKNSFMAGFALFFKILFRIFGVVVLLAAICAGVFLFKYGSQIRDDMKEAHTVVSDSTKSTFQSRLTSYIYDDEDNLIAKLSVDKDADYLDYEDIPADVIHAFIAVEDRNFYEHNGVDIKGLIRVGINYIKTKGKEMHGASTITQQLVRNVFITKEVTIERKLKEICYACEIEKKYTKKEILEFYVNNIYFANGYYGIESAARGYFSKSTKDLSLSEMAFLCAIPNSPSYYDPLQHQDRTIERRDKILKNMLECEMISEAEYDDAINEEIVLNPEESIDIQDYETSYALDCATRYLMKRNRFEFRYSFDSMSDYKSYLTSYNEEYENTRAKLYTSGYTIKTTLNREAQDILQEAVDSGLSFDTQSTDEGIYKLQGAATCIDNETGKVVAIVGGRSQEENSDTLSLNRAYQSYRQPGSSIKPLIVYTPSLERGYTDTSTVMNIDVTAAKEKGADVSKLTGPTMTLRSAVEQSKNGVAWSLFYKLTPEVGLSYLQKMKFQKIVPDDYYCSSALGGLTYGATTVEMATGYSTLANLGKFKEATCITSIKDKNGEEIYEEAEREQVYEESAAYLMVDILKGVITRGTASSLNWSASSKVEAAGKTGTTNESKDGWFCGITPAYSISVWVGYDQPEKLSTLYGGTYPAKIWKQAMIGMLNITDSYEEKFKEADKDASLNSSGAMGYYDYLPGRDDEEVLSEGYTVKNYREDHILADQAEALLSQLSIMDVNSDEDVKKGEAVYQQALGYIDQIYGRSLYSEEMKKAEEVYEIYKEKTEIYR